MLALRILLLSLLAFGCAAQPTPFNNERTDTQTVFEVPATLRNAGITDINCLFRDSHHFLWIGTEYGLYRFDGTHLIHFSYHVDDSASLPSNKILTVTETRDGIIWVGTFKSIAAIHPTTLHVYRYNRSAMLFDEKLCRDTRGVLWAGEASGIYRMNDGVFQKVWRAGKDSSYILSLAVLDDTQLLARTMRGTVIFNKYSFSAYRYNFTTNASGADGKGHAYLALADGAILSWNSGAKDFVAERGISAFLKLHRGVSVQCLSVDPSAKGCMLRIGTSAGLAVFEISGSGSVSKGTFYARTSEMPITAVLDDGAGSLWTGTPQRLYQATPGRIFFNTCARIDGSCVDIQPFGATQLAVASWYGHHGLEIIDPSGTQAPTFVRPALGDREEADCSNYAIDRLGRIWISTLGGLSVLNKDMRVVRQWKRGDSDADKLTNYRTAGIAIYHDTVFVSCYHSGIDQIDLSFHRVGHLGAMLGLKDDIINSFYTDPKDGFWICGNEFLYRYQGSEPLRCYTLTHSSGGCSPTDICMLRDGRYVVSSAYGLIFFNAAKDSFAYLHHPVAETEQRFNSVATDSRGNIWALTNRRLLRIEGNGRVTVYGPEDGLQEGNPLNVIRCINVNDFFIGQNGLITHFDARQMLSLSPAPGLWLRLQISNSEVAAPLEGSLELQPSENTLHFFFSAITFIKPEQSSYQYFLEGAEQHWSTTTNDELTYARLAPGNYTFHIRAVNYAGRVSEEQTLHLSIAPPWWRRWWAIALLLSLLVSITAALARYHVRRRLREQIHQLEKEAAVEKERTRIAQDMHDELGSGLTKIAILSEVAKAQLREPYKAQTQLESITQSSRGLVDNLQDIIWILNPRYDSLESLALYVREYALRFFEATEIELHFAYPEHLPTLTLSEDQRRSVFMAIREALNNIAKHAEASVISILLEARPGTISFSIRDNGRGFNVAGTRSFANGLNNMKSRMEHIGGTCAIQSESETGTTVVLHFQTLVA